MKTPTQRLKRVPTQLTPLYQDRSWAGSVHPPKRLCRRPLEPTLCCSFSHSPVTQIARHRLHWLRCPLCPIFKTSMWMSLQSLITLSVMSYRLLQVWTLCSIILTLLILAWISTAICLSCLLSFNLKCCLLINLILISRLYTFLSCPVLEGTDDAPSAMSSLVLIALLCITDFFPHGWHFTHIMSVSLILQHKLIICPYCLVNLWARSESPFPHGY